MDSFKKLAASFKFVKESVSDALSFGDGEEHKYIGFCQAGLTAESSGNVEAAEENYLAALASAELGGKYCLGVSIPVTLLADLYQNNNRFAEADGLYRHAIEIYEKYELINSEAKTRFRDAVGRANYAQLEAMYQRFRSLTDLLYPDRDNHKIHLFESYAALLRKTDQRTAAEVIELKAETLRMKK